MSLPRSWRWLVVITDLPPMLPHSEVVHGYWTRRSAEHEASMRRAGLPGGRRYTAVEVRRATR